jgi:16S rRNA (guanine966-N2)-methyltransferase
MMGGVGRHKRQDVRVIAGRYKGRLLAYPRAAMLRPTMGKTREALFSAIQERLPGHVFVDLFCAAGGVGIEALSRGASVVHFVESAPQALDCLRRNLDSCRVDAARYRIHPEDVFGYLERGGLDALPDTMLFADPPYEGDFTERLLRHFGETEYENVLLFVLEHRNTIDALRLGRMVRSKTRQYGDTTLTFWSRQG